MVEPNSLSFTVIAILFAATLVHSTLGFGTALVAMPLLSAIVDLRTATPLVALTVLTTISILLARTWRHIDVRAAWQLLLSSAAGIPLGVLVLRFAPGHLVTIGLGLLLIVVGLYNVKSPTLPVLKWGTWVYVFGFISGVLGGAYNLNAAPVVIYGVMRRWPPRRFQATLQGYFLPAGVLICASHGFGGLWTQGVFGFYLAAVPVVILAVFLGHRIGVRISVERFERALYMALIAFGALLLWQK